MVASDILLEDLEAILERCGEEVWDRLRNQSIFLSGGTGWLGRWMLEAIAHANRRLGVGVRVTVLTRSPKVFAQQAPWLVCDPALTFVCGDVRDFSMPTQTFKFVIHAATTSARETFTGESGLAKFSTLVDGTRHVLDYVARCQVEAALFTSSGVVYSGADGKIPFIESSCCAPYTTDTLAALGHAKRAAEYLCAEYAQQYGWRFSIARGFSFVGPFMPMDVHYAIGNFIQQALNEPEIVVAGDGLPVRSYLYMADQVVWLFRMLCARQSGVARYNVGSDQSINIGELAVLVRDLLAPKKQVRVLGGSGIAIGNPVREVYVPDIGAARRELGVQVWTSLSEAITRTARYATSALAASGSP